jgi:hypothetical protein
VAAVARVLDAGGPEERAALVVKLRITADAYASG